MSEEQQLELIAAIAIVFDKWAEEAKANEALDKSDLSKAYDDLPF